MEILIHLGAFFPVRTSGRQEAGSMEDAPFFPTDADDPAEGLLHEFAKLEANRTGTATFAEACRGKQKAAAPSGPKLAALCEFLKAVAGTEFERPIWSEYHRRKGMDDSARRAAAGIAQAEHLADPEGTGTIEVWSGYLLEHLRRFAGTLSGWEARHSAPHLKKNWPDDELIRNAIIRLQSLSEPCTNVMGFCREFAAANGQPPKYAGTLRTALYRYSEHWQSHE